LIKKKFFRIFFFLCQLLTEPQDWCENFFLRIFQSDKTSTTLHQQTSWLVLYTSMENNELQEVTQVERKEITLPFLNPAIWHIRIYKKMAAVAITAQVLWILLQWSDIFNAKCDIRSVVGTIDQDFLFTCELRPDTENLRERIEELNNITTTELDELFDGIEYDCSSQQDFYAACTLCGASLYSAFTTFFVSNFLDRLVFKF
jgi:hypothetical protein